MVHRSVVGRMTSQPIWVYANRRRAGPAAVLFGLIMFSIIGGVVTGRTTAVALVLLVLVVPTFTFYFRRASQQFPVLAIEPARLVYASKEKAMRWDSVVDAYVRESRGLFGFTNHELFIKGVVDRTSTARKIIDRSATAPGPDGLSQMVIGTIDGLSLPWGDIATLVEERLPSTVVLKRDSL
jgi:hypothetical protein